MKGIVIVSRSTYLYIIELVTFFDLKLSKSSNNYAKLMKLWAPIYKILNLVKSNPDRLHIALTSVHSLVSGFI